MPESGTLSLVPLALSLNTSSKEVTAPVGKVNALRIVSDCTVEVVNIDFG
jgi:hypothetical protein